MSEDPIVAEGAKWFKKLDKPSGATYRIAHARYDNTATVFVPAEVLEEYRKTSEEDATSMAEELNTAYARAVQRTTEAIERAAKQNAVPTMPVVTAEMEEAGRKYARENDPSTFAGIFEAMRAVAPKDPICRVCPRETLQALLDAIEYPPPNSGCSGYVFIPKAIIEQAREALDVPPESAA